VAKPIEQLANQNTSVASVLWVVTSLPAHKKLMIRSVEHFIDIE